MILIILKIIVIVIRISYDKWWYNNRKCKS